MRMRHQLAFMLRGAHNDEPSIYNKQKNLLYLSHWIYIYICLLYSLSSLQKETQCPCSELQISCESLFRTQRIHQPTQHHDDDIHAHRTYTRRLWRQTKALGVQYSNTVKGMVSQERKILTQSSCFIYIDKYTKKRVCHVRGFCVMILFFSLSVFSFLFRLLWQKCLAHGF